MCLNMSEIVSGKAAFPCYDHVPRTIVVPLTNGGMLRSMDNHQLAKWLAEEASASEAHGAKTEADYLETLGKPVSGEDGIVPQGRGPGYRSLAEIPTCGLVAELRTREGVEATDVAPGFTGSLRVTGPAVALNVID